QAHGWLTEGPGEAAGSAVAAAEAWVGRVAHARTRAAALDREAAELVARLASARDEVTAPEADERRRSETVVRLAAERAEVERVGFWERLAAAGFADLADL